jgi:flagellar assembly protein FliH
VAEVIRAPKLSEPARALSARPTPRYRGKEPGKTKATADDEAPVPESQQTDTAAREQTSRPLEQASSSVESTAGPAPTEPLRPDAPETAIDASTLAAEHRLHEIQEELARDRRAAIEEGRMQGYQDGMQASREALDEELERLKALIEGLSNEKSKRLSEAEDAIVEVVGASIAKILGEVMLTPEGVVAAVRNAIAQLTQRDKLIVRISPDDFALLEAERHKLLEGLDDTSVELVQDDRVKLGGCLLETKSGSLDGRLEVQLQRLSDVLLNARAQRQTSTGI